ncbi:MAG TPA: hypothetical protein VE224_13070 [Pseudolabrys sp.]|nr:hypothetical protein [Pseudolabrys sp.]
MTPPESVAEVEVASPERSPPRSPDEIQTFLAAISTVLHETVAAFELTVSRITEIAVSRHGRPDRELVVALQDFDRLQQEFATLGQILGKMSVKVEPGHPEAKHGHEAIADVSLADLKDRLAHQLMVLTSELPDVPPEDVEF